MPNPQINKKSNPRKLRWAISTNTNDNEFVNIATSFYYQNDNSHVLNWKSFKCILVTVMRSDSALQNSNGSPNLGAGSPNWGAGSQEEGAWTVIRMDPAQFYPWCYVICTSHNSNTTYLTYTLWCRMLPDQRPSARLASIEPLELIIRIWMPSLSRESNFCIDLYAVTVVLLPVSWNFACHSDTTTRSFCKVGCFQN